MNDFSFGHSESFVKNLFQRSFNVRTAKLSTRRKKSICSFSPRNKFRRSFSVPYERFTRDYCISKNEEERREIKRAILFESSRAESVVREKLWMDFLKEYVCTYVVSM